MITTIRYVCVCVHSMHCPHHSVSIHTVHLHACTQSSHVAVTLSGIQITRCENTKQRTPNPSDNVRAGQSLPDELCLNKYRVSLIEGQAQFPYEMVPPSADQPTHKPGHNSILPQYVNFRRILFNSTCCTCYPICGWFIQIDFIVQSYRENVRKYRTGNTL